MPKFIKGLELCESFFHEHALAIIENNYPDLKFSAGVLSYGSDVLGYDDDVSSDHMWGPRFYLFLSEQDIHIKDELMELFESQLPYTHKGFSINFSAPDPNDGGVRRAEYIESGKVSPLIWIYTIDEFVTEYLGKMPADNLDWLAISEHRLLGFTSGKVFIDMLGLSEVRDKLSFYPRDVKLYLIASQWALIAQEQAFVKRCSDSGDEIGSRIVCTRIAERLMRLCFLYMDKYAPYSKWFGAGFRYLAIDDEIRAAITAAIGADTIYKREKYIVQAQVLVAELHNKSNITQSLDIRVQKYYGRDIDVIFADEIAEKVKEKISDLDLKQCPLIGSMSQVGNFVSLSDSPRMSDRIRRLYES